jgi:hypothetical protein
VALELKWRDERSGAQLGKGYVRVLQVEVEPGARVVRVHLGVYADAGARADGRGAVGTELLEARGKDYARLVEQVGGGGLVARCYAWVKKHEAFAGAADV